MAQVVWLPRAYEDLDDIHRFIAQERPRAAESVVGRIIGATRNLSTFPRIGRIVPEIGQADIREVFVQDIRIIYRLKNDTVLILAVRHGAQLLRDIPGL